MDYIEQSCEALGILYAEARFTNPTEKLPIHDLPDYDFTDVERNSQIASMLNLDTALFQLRVEEALLAEQLVKVRKAIQQTRGRQA